MDNVGIRVEGLSKRYRIGGPKERYYTLRDTLANAVKAPFGRLRFTLSPMRSADYIWALRDVSFEVKQGEVIGIIGGNGAGKTTLLKILSRITEPTEGRAEIRGRVGSLLEVGTGFHPELTGRENIYLSGAILGMKKVEIETKFDEIVAFAEVEKFTDTPVKHYSSGMYVRLAFAVAAHLEPEILLVDEVLAVGDFAFQTKCLGKMEHVAKEGRTVLFVSHNMAAILNLCKWAILLDSGRIMRSGNTGRVVDQYLTESVELRGSASIPKNESSSDDFRFSSISVLKPGNGPTSQVSLIEGFDVQLEYEICSPIKGTNIVIHLWDTKGNCVLTSTDVDHRPSSIVEVRKPGRYKARCHISRQFLRAGRYYIGISSSVPCERVFADFPRILAFDVVDTGGVESLIGQGREGVISPVLDWITQRVDDF